jgi:BirA family transcriptional regulator, biotin operon repressor / biotin---[acetyl-CoA-carboxylase] ligase
MGLPSVNLRMNEETIQAALRNFPMGGLRFFQTIGSTNDTAMAWAAEGAQDFSLVVADAQTHARGRGNHTWYTPPGAGLAFSLVMRPGTIETQKLPIFSALGAMAVASVLESINLAPQIKWPNDILLGGRKVCGTLVDTAWSGESLVSIVLGIGLNVNPASVPSEQAIEFPATCLEDEAKRSLDRSILLGDILFALLNWRPRLGTTEFLQAWQEHLAYLGEMVEIRTEGGSTCRGRIEGLGQDGSLRLLGEEDGRAFTIQFGEVHLRPVI